MTTTPTASPELSHLDHLEALARAATPGPWSWWTSNSTLRLTGADGRDGGVLYGYARQGDGDVNCAPNDQAFIAAANPAAVLALIALARRAQPEGEAPQAVPAMWVQYIDGVKTQNVARDDKEKATVESIHRTMAPGTKMTWRALYDHAPAATLSPLCGAQHAESGKEVAPQGYAIVPLIPTGAMNKAAVLYLNGPDIYSAGLAPTVLEIEESIYHEVYRAMIAAAPVVAPNCGACPGDGSVCATHCKLANESPRAAQLDGGQEGSESNG